MTKSGFNGNIVLIGYRAVGKTSVGRLVARLLERPFVDLDDVLAQEAGESIPNLVARSGWGEFRRREKAVVQRFAAETGRVIAAGGGVVLDPENVAQLKATGKLVWLKASPSTIKARLRRDSKQLADRPGLTARGALDEVDEVLDEREPIYEAAADATLSVDTDSPAAVAASLVELVRGWEPPGE